MLLLTRLLYLLYSLTTLFNFSLGWEGGLEFDFQKSAAPIYINLSLSLNSFFISGLNRHLRVLILSEFIQASFQQRNLNDVRKKLLNR